MIALFLVGLSGGGLLAGLVKQRNYSTLVDKLSHQPSKSQAQATESAVVALDGFGSRLSHLDDRYQIFVQTHLDPLLVSELREEQMRQISQTDLRKLNAQERANNRRLALGVAGLGVLGLRSLAQWPLTPVVLIIGLYNGWPWLKESWRIAVSERRLSLLHFLVLYLLSLWLGGHYLIGVIGILLSGLGHKIEWLTQTVTRHSLTHLLGELPTKVWVMRGGEECSIPFEELLLGDILVLTAGQLVPVDGVVVEGAAIVDQHRLTGESQPVEKGTGDLVLAATFVLGGRVGVRVDKTGTETAAARIGEVLNQTVEQQEIRLADQFKSVEKYRWHTLAGGCLGLVLRGPQTGLTMLGANFMTSQIPLRLLTLLNGLGTGAERGVLIKDGRALERLPKIDTIVFDKTGTLTLHQQQVAKIHGLPPFCETQVLAFAASTEQRQSHPIAEAIRAEASRQDLDLPTMEDAVLELGLGLKAQVEGQTVRLGSQRFLSQQGLELPPELAEIQTTANARGNGLVFLALDNVVAGAIELAAIPRPEALATVEWLKQNGLSTYIISGDQEAPTAALAAELGIDGWFANTLPEEKAERIQALSQKGKRVCFIGDGINDAIALRKAEVSISLRGATTVATDSAQVVLMEEDLSQLRVLWELAQGFENSLSSNARQALRTSLLAGIAVLLLPLGFGYLSVELLWGLQIVAGIKIALQPLLQVSAE
ncbi:MAG: heavy metal translocating P-type ATPase [Cyanobacteriota bacterium]|nr:heavy metal translocating P-type ATPase [Cyanobacteriota bacterium]